MGSATTVPRHRLSSDAWSSCEATTTNSVRFMFNLAVSHGRSAITAIGFSTLVMNLMGVDSNGGSCSIMALTYRRS